MFAFSLRGFATGGPLPSREIKESHGRLQQRNCSIGEIETSLLCEAGRGTVDPGMSFAEIEAELKKLTPDQLRQLALKSWTEFVARESCEESGNECNEGDPHLLAALDEAIEKAA